MQRKYKISLLVPLWILVVWCQNTRSQERSFEDKPGTIFSAKPAVRQVTLTGFTRARHVMDIVSEEAGRCEIVAADVGDVIGKDGIFVHLDRVFIDLALENNRIAQARLENLVAFYGKEVRRFQQLVSRETAA